MYHYKEDDILEKAYLLSLDINRRNLNSDQNYYDALNYVKSEDLLYVCTLYIFKLIDLSIYTIDDLFRRIEPIKIYKIEKKEIDSDKILYYSAPVSPNKLVFPYKFCDWYTNEEKIIIKTSVFEYCLHKEILYVIKYFIKKYGNISKYIKQLIYYNSIYSMVKHYNLNNFKQILKICDMDKTYFINLNFLSNSFKCNFSNYKYIVTKYNFNKNDIITHIYNKLSMFDVYTLKYLVNRFNIYIPTKDLYKIKELNLSIKYIKILSYKYKMIRKNIKNKNYVNIFKLIY